MATLLRELFVVNRPLVFFVYGLIFFVLGLAIALQSRRHSRLILARSLHWLALFGFIHGLHQWGDVFIPIQAAYLSPDMINLLTAIQEGMLAISFACLFQFGLDLLRPMPHSWTWLRWLPISLVLLWSVFAFVCLVVMPTEWNGLPDIWARYLLGFPGAALAAYGLRRQTFQLIAPFGDFRTLQMLQLVGLALAGYAVLAGILVPPGPFFPANWLNTNLLERWLGIPVQTFRGLLGLVLTLAVIRALEVFDLEIDRKLSAMEEAQILAAERERIGRDLHDHTLQSVYAAGLMLSAARHSLHQPEGEVVVDSLIQAETILDQTVADIRRYIAELQAQPTSVSLAEGLTKLVHESALTSMAEVDLILDIPEDQPLNAHQVSHLLAIAGEALSNVARHARARHLQLSAQMQSNYLLLTVADDGQGIPPDYVAGYGLRNMHERARLLGGELVVNSQLGRGTRLELVVPWNQDEV